MVTTYSGGVERDDTGSVWAVTDWTDDHVVDCDSDDADLGDAFGTLIKELIQLGILKGSVVSKV